ncbi:LPS assembly lipoprotein LptE [Sphingomonas oryzagri]|jgi:LPS-assembly lipoprotein|uniref:LPS assembly lipoprotein LptE n=1 Tax=Sphingomonas oryzagri TaxID=3042314 RepID=A0ABT6N559_9SPHN|nr:LPS assembly lipoprotein LptE [Sphingomonas oryzagri]MDH7640230.1 LPS assembly lipoprotein LptE [Sphingomonas oryzagri]
MKRFARLLPLLALALPLAGCGLHPLYEGGMHGAVAEKLSGIEVGAISGQSGWLMRNALNDRLGATGHSETPRYKLVVDLSDQISGLGINQQGTVTRERRVLRARFRLVTNDAAGTTLLDASAGSDAGIDAVSSDYATVAAEQTALENLVDDVADQIVARVAVFARHNKDR